MSFLYPAIIQKNHRISNDIKLYISGIKVCMTCSKQHAGMISKLF